MVSHRKRELFDLAAQLTRTGRSLVIASVVRREGLSSAHQGDMAIVTDTGEFYGWIGGGCTRPTIEREAALALGSRQPRLIVLSPDPARDPRAGVLVFPMTCHSGGTVEIYLDPVVASPRLALFGRSPIISALGALAHAIGYLVDVADPDALADELPGADRIFTSVDAPELAGATYIVVGTMGDLDEEAVVRALALRPAYVGVIASRRRYALLCDALIARGISTEVLAALTNPAGLDLGAREPGEVAVSILAQIVARRNAVAAVRESGASIDAGDTSDASASTLGASVSTLPIAPPAPAPAPATAIDPVCKMTVTIATAKHVADWGARSWYFCCGACKAKFLAAPATYDASANARHEVAG
jgi:xanthine dehydrogenase accessory factor